MTEKNENPLNETLEEKLKTRHLLPSEIKGKKGAEIDIDEKLIRKTSDGNYVKEMKEHIRDYQNKTDITFKTIIESANNIGLHTHITGEVSGEVRKKAAEVMREECPSERITKKDYGHDKEGEMYRVNGDDCIDFKVRNELGIHARPSALMAKKAIYLCNVYGGELGFISDKNNKKSELDAQSILAWMMNAFEKGERVTITRKNKYENNKRALVDYYNYATSKEFLSEEN